MSRRSIVIALAVAIASVMTIAGLVLAVISVGGGGFGLAPRIAVIEVNGVIEDDQEYLEQIRRFRDDGSVRGYVVSINSPGGVVGPSQSIFRELKRLREDGKPVVAAIRGVGASGGYYVAAAADSIFTLPGSITGSIGVIMQMPEASELLERVGVRVESVQSAEHKDAGSPFRPLTPEDRELLGAVVNDVFEQFVEVVIEERDLPPDVVRGVADGRILSGRQAVELGLADRIGNLHDAFAAAGRMTGLGDDPRIVSPPRRRFTLLDLILGRGAARALAEWTVPARWVGGPRLTYVVPF